MLQLALSNEITDRMGVLISDAQTLKSLTAGDPRTREISPVELHASLSLYRSLCELHTLLEFYNKNFDSQLMKDAQKLAGGYQINLERRLCEILDLSTAR